MTFNVVKFHFTFVTNTNIERVSSRLLQLSCWPGWSSEFINSFVLNRSITSAVGRTIIELLKGLHRGNRGGSKLVLIERWSYIEDVSVRTASDLYSAGKREAEVVSRKGT